MKGECPTPLFLMICDVAADRGAEEKGTKEKVNGKNMQPNDDACILVDRNYTQVLSDPRIREVTRNQRACSAMNSNNTHTS